ncbi:MAG: hypothetical protein IJ746_02270 [Ruminococcus sp.]|nr:hypothetical protein [Ruminococcus sp.]
MNKIIMMYDALAGIDESYILAALKYPEAAAKRKRRLGLGLAAACAGAAVAVFPLVNDRKAAKPEARPESTGTATAYIRERAESTPDVPPAAAPGWAYVRFESTLIKEGDAYSEEQLPEVTLIYEDRYYRQLATERAAELGIGESLPEEAFGAPIGTVTEIDTGSTDLPLASQEPTLAGAEVFLYAPADCPAMVIVRQGGACGIFEYTELRGSFRESFAFFGASGPEDIESVSYTVSDEEEGRLTDPESLGQLWQLLCSLEPEPEPADPRAPTPQWYIDAWEAYRAAPTAPREDILLTFNFKNGTRLAEVLYQPYIGDGCVSGMQELTPEQNSALRGLF